MALNIEDLMKAAQEMQQKMQAAQEDLIKFEVTGEAGGGLVKVKLNGRNEMLSVYISQEAMQEKKSVIEDLIVAAYNNARDKVEKATKEKLTKLTSGLPKEFTPPPKDEE